MAKQPVPLPHHIYEDTFLIAGSDNLYIMLSHANGLQVWSTEQTVAEQNFAILHFQRREAAAVKNPKLPPNFIRLYWSKDLHWREMQGFVHRFRGGELILNKLTTLGIDYAEEISKKYNDFDISVLRFSISPPPGTAPEDRTIGQQASIL